MSSTNVAAEAAPLRSIRPERGDRDAHGDAGVTAVAVGAIGERTAAAESLPHELAENRVAVARVAGDRAARPGR